MVMVTVALRDTDPTLALIGIVAVPVWCGSGDECNALLQVGILIAVIYDYSIVEPSTTPIGTPGTEIKAVLLGTVSRLF